jgi:hypothetical protein
MTRPPRKATVRKPLKDCTLEMRPAGTYRVWMRMTRSVLTKRLGVSVTHKTNSGTSQLFAWLTPAQARAARDWIDDYLSRSKARKGKG